MIRQLAQCPYCSRCEIALDDHPQLVFNPDSDPQSPCPHLAWLDGRYSQWEHTSREIDALPPILFNRYRRWRYSQGGQTPHGTNRMIGSVEFRWDMCEPGAEERANQLLPYLHELFEAGSGWTFAPAEAFVIARLNAEQKAPDPRHPQGEQYPVWDVDGWAIFAENPAAFWAALPACQERWSAELDVKRGEEK